MSRLIQSIRDSDAVAASMAEAHQSIDQALAILETMPDCAERQSLEQLARYTASRNL
jgi:geranylgeranyl pyrophosphate synthase